MKKIAFFFTIILFSCHKEQIKITNEIGVNYAYISMDKKYGQPRKPPCNMSKTIIKDNEYTMYIYKDTVNFKIPDTLKLTDKGNITLNSVKATLVDTKTIVVKNKKVIVRKIYIPHPINEISVDNYGGKIIYFTDEGLIVKYAIISNYITLYRPELYAEIHNMILYKKNYFKRHKAEMEGYMP